MSHLKAIEAGVDIIDTCMSPYAYRTSHAAVEPLVMALLGTKRDTGFDIRLLIQIDEIFEKEVMTKYKHPCYDLYGKTAVPIDSEVHKKALRSYDRGEEPITCRSAEVLEPELEKATASELVEKKKPQCCKKRWIKTEPIPE